VHYDETGATGSWLISCSARSAACRSIAACADPARPRLARICEAVLADPVRPHPRRLGGSQRLEPTYADAAVPSVRPARVLTCVSVSDWLEALARLGAGESVTSVALDVGYAAERLHGDVPARTRRGAPAICVGRTRNRVAVGGSDRILPFGRPAEAAANQRVCFVLRARDTSTRCSCIRPAKPRTAD